MSIAAMKQALEALEELNKASIGVDAVPLPGEIDTAMDALRAAIEQAEKQKPVAWMSSAALFRHSETDEVFRSVATPLYAHTAPQSINDFKPDWDTVKAYDEKFAEMLDEQQQLRAELKRTKQRLHDVATLCANVEGVLKAVNTAAMKLTADLTCMEVDNDDRLDRDHVMERVMRWRNEWDKAMFEYKPKAAPRQWIGLTEEEIEQGKAESWVSEQAFESAVWWAEAKLKDKNHG